MGELDREAYLRHRFGGSQRLVHWRELRLVEQLLGGLSLGDGPVLDAPSGHGRLLVALRAAGARRVACLDGDPRHLAALARAEPAGTPWLVRADLRATLPFPADAFALTVCFRYLHHVRGAEDRRRLLAELTRVTRGALLLSYYAAAPLHRLQRAVHRALGRRRAPLALLRPAELHALLAERGWALRREVAVLPGLHAQRVALFAPGR